MPPDPHPVVLPAPSPNQTYVTISALQGGSLTLPERLFVTDASPTKRATVPSLSFLIQHPSAPSPTTPTPSSTPKPQRLLFDLGLKRDLQGYRSAQQAHIANRQPTLTHPDVAASLLAGGLDPQDIDTVILSHVHWDHVGTSSDFSNAKFIVGSGTMDLLRNGAGDAYPKELFNADEVPRERTWELPPVGGVGEEGGMDERAFERRTGHVWRALVGDGGGAAATSQEGKESKQNGGEKENEETTPFPHTIDFFSDNSLYIIDSPGHLPGHINLLARTGPRKWVYLGGDCCHDVRILTGEKGIAMYDDGKGGLRSVHADTAAAERTVGRIARLVREGGKRVVEEGGGEVSVEVVVAHDGGWAERNGDRFWPGCL